MGDAASSDFTWALGMYCGEQTAVKYEGRKRTAVSLRCRSWNCEDCADVRKRQLIAEVMSGSPTKFITLTIRRTKDGDPIAAARKLSQAWRKLRLRIMRKYGWRKLPFFAVFEPHVSGWPHMHIAARCGWIDQKWLSAQMLELLDSPVVGIEAVRDKRKVGWYVAKYMGKGTSKFGTSKRYWQSADYDLSAEETATSKRTLGGGWEVERTQLKRWAQQAATLGWAVVWKSNCKVEATIPP